MDEQEPLVRDAERLGPTVRQDDHAENERRRGVQAGERDRGPAHDQHPPGRGAADEGCELEEQQDEAGGEQDGRGDREPVATRGDADGERRPGGEQCEDEPAEAWPGWVVPEHHRKQLPHGSGNGEGKKTRPIACAAPTGPRPEIERRVSSTAESSRRSAAASQPPKATRYAGAPRRRAPAGRSPPSSEAAEIGSARGQPSLPAHPGAG